MKAKCLKYIYLIVVTILEFITTMLCLISNIVVTLAFYINNEYWDNGPLPGYEYSSDVLEVLNNIRIWFTIVILAVNALFGIISIIKAIINHKKSRVININCFIETLIVNTLISIIFFITQICTYGQGV